VQNPLGILFHPKAIETLITNAINEKEYSHEDIFTQNERYHSFDAHSKLSDVSPEKLLENLNQAIEKTQQQIHQATHMIITLGTAWVYRFIASDRIVANCHKVPQKQFLKELITVAEIVESLDAIITLIREVNPNLNFIFTVSPVRHLKDGFVENQRSKSHLIAAIHELVEPRKRIFYFPSYEMLMDELRDYRFYAEDMVHPNATAIQYIWERFADTWISASASLTMKQVHSIQKRRQHKPFNPNSEEHAKFLRTLEQDVENLRKQLPHSSL
jgi:lysophospholipase L1-like esterase